MPGFPLTFPSGGGGVSNPFTEAFTITPASPNVTPLTLNQSLTGANAQSALSITPTWNTSGAPTALDVNVTNTASASTSNLLNLRVGGSSVFKVDRQGLISSDASFAAFLSVNGSFVSAGRAVNGIGLVGFGDSGGAGFGIGFFNTSVGVLSWGPSSNLSGTPDLFLRREAAGILSTRNSTSPQTFRVYGTFTDASNGDWLNITKAAGGTATISTQANGTGTAGNLVFGTPTGSITVGGGVGGPVTTSSNLVCNGGLTAGTFVLCSNTSALGSVSRGNITFPADGVFTLNNNAGNDFWRLNFGGTTSAFPALKRNGVGFDVVRADDTAGSFIRTVPVAVASLPSAATAGNGAKAHVTDANATTFASIVAGGGSNGVPVYSDGTNWRIG